MKRARLIDVSDYISRFGRAPERDDLQRVNCDRAGEPGHFLCGVCPTHDRPRFICGCIRITTREVRA